MSNDNCNFLEYRNRLHQEPIIMDDFLPNDFLDKYEEAAHTSIQWDLTCYRGTSNYSTEFLKEKGIKDVHEQFQFTNNAMSKTGGGNEDVSIDSIKNLHFWSIPLTIGLMKMNLWYDARTLIRVKANFQTRASADSKGKYNFPHNDLRFDPGATEYWGPDITTAIFYINDCDGDTVLFKNPPFDSEDNPIKDHVEYINSLEEDMRISPKKGRLLLFPASKVHAGCHPIQSNNRLVVNYNFLPITTISQDPDEEYKKMFGSK